MTKSPHSVSVVIPGYNEEANVEETVARCSAALEPLVSRFEVVIVNDGSTDRMGEIADAMARRSPTVRVVHNPINLGVGMSLLIGMRAAQCDLVVHNAMDYPFDLADLAAMLPLFPENDIVVVVRTNRAAHSPYRKVTSLVNYWLIRILFRIGLRDMNFVQVYKREVLQSLRAKARSPAFVTPELLIQARDRGLRVAEVRAPFHPRRRGRPSYGKPRDILWALADMMSFWIERWSAPAPPRPAAPAAAPEDAKAGDVGVPR
jgi:glycosyltransferase involved in cell wall biosynthesis